MFFLWWGPPNKTKNKLAILETTLVSKQKTPGKKKPEWKVRSVDIAMCFLQSLNEWILILQSNWWPPLIKYLICVTSFFSSCWPKHFCQVVASVVGKQEEEEDEQAGVEDGGGGGGDGVPALRHPLLVEGGPLRHGGDEGKDGGGGDHGERQSWSFLPQTSASRQYQAGSAGGHLTKNIIFKVDI